MVIKVDEPSYLIGIVSLTPMYMGGLIKEVIFQEVINNSETQGEMQGVIVGYGKESF